MSINNILSGGVQDHNVYESAVARARENVRGHEALTSLLEDMRRRAVWHLEGQQPSGLGGYRSAPYADATVVAYLEGVVDQIEAAIRAVKERK